MYVFIYNVCVYMYIYIHIYTMSFQRIKIGPVRTRVTWGRRGEGSYFEAVVRKVSLGGEIGVETLMRREQASG